MEPTPGKPVPVNLIRLNYIQISIVIKRIVAFVDFSLSEAGNVVVESFKESHGNFPNSATRIVRRWKWLIGECLLMCKCWTLRNENSVWSVWSPWSKAFLLFVLSGLLNILLLKSNLSCKGKPDVPMQPSWPCFSVNFQICVPGRIWAFILDTYLGFYACLFVQDQYTTLSPTLPTNPVKSTCSYFS